MYQFLQNCILLYLRKQTFFPKFLHEFTKFLKLKKKKLFAELGEERENGGQNRCAPTIGFTFRKGTVSLSLSLSAIFCFSFQKDDECVLVYVYTVIITYHIIIISLYI